MRGGSGSARGAAKSDQRGRPHHHHLAGSLLCSGARSLEEQGRAPGALNDFDGPHPRTIGAFVSARPMAPLLGPPISHPELQLFPAFGATSARHHYKLALNSRLETPFLPLSPDKWPFSCTLPMKALPRLPAASGKGGR
ncbi:hypothetical protein NN561_017562 [Cricetulus griseus]